MTLTEPVQPDLRRTARRIRAAALAALAVVRSRRSSAPAMTFGIMGVFGDPVVRPEHPRPAGLAACDGAE